MTVVGSAEILISVSGAAAAKRELSSTQTALAGLPRPADRLSASLGGTTSALGALSGAAAIAGGALVLGGVATTAIRALGQVTAAAFEASASFEQIQMSLQSLATRELRNANATLDMSEAFAMAGDRAQELFEWTQQLAIKSPFDAEGVAKALRQAMAYGFTSDEAQRLTQTTLDMSAALGGSTDQMNRVVRALGQMENRGKVSMQEIIQLTEAGVDAMGILGNAFNLSGEQLQDAFVSGQIGASEAVEAIVSRLENDFGGAAERMTNSLSGIRNSFQDLKALFLTKVFTPAFEAAKPVLSAVVNLMQNRLVPAAENVGVVLAALAGGAIAWLGSAFVPLIATAGVFLGALGALGQAVGVVRKAFENDFAGIKTAFDTVWNDGIKPAIDELKRAFQTEIKPAFQEVKRAFDQELKPALQELGIELSPLPSIAEAIASAIKAMAQALTSLTPIITKVLSTFDSDAFQSFATGITKASSAVNSLKSSLSGLGLPPNFTPGSPTPAEMGFRGIAEAVRGMNTQVAASGSAMNTGGAAYSRNFTRNNNSVNIYGPSYFPNSPSESGYEQLRQNRMAQGRR